MKQAEDNFHITAELDLPWENIRAIRERIGARLATRDTGIRTSTMMAASELLENAMKYGEPVPAASRIRFDLTVSETTIELVVSNGCSDIGWVDALRECIERVRFSADRESLFTERLEQLLDNPNQSARLGIYRIGFEGAFDLRCSYQDKVVQITATRSLT
jgi:hypothetical protein